MHQTTFQRRSAPLGVALAHVALACLAIATGTRPALGEVLLPRPLGDPPIVASATAAQSWQEGGYTVWHLTGDCRVTQDANQLVAGEVILMVPLAPVEVSQILIYAEPVPGGEVELVHRGSGGSSGRQLLPEWFGSWSTRTPIDWRGGQLTELASGRWPPIYDRARSRFGPAIPSSTRLVKNGQVVGGTSPTAQESSVELAQFQQLAPVPGPVVPNSRGVRRVQVFSRSDVGANFDARVLPNGESVMTVSGGVNVIIEGLESEDVTEVLGPLGKLDIQTDRAVIWSTNPLSASDFQQQNDVPLEIYMEGNIVFRQGNRTIYADRMYYDVRRRVGTVINAELLTPLPQTDNFDYQGLVRLKAGVIQQLDPVRFMAYDAVLTTSRLEVPSYHLGSQTIAFQDVPQPMIDPVTGAQAVDPYTGEPQFKHQHLAQSQANTLYFGNVPVFYWPTIATNLEEPTYYIDNIRISNDSIYGFQAMLDFDMFQLLGVTEPPRGTDWDLSVDYLSRRGLGLGTTMEYNRDAFFDILGPTSGLFDLWGIKDNGLDNLGFGRRTIEPEEDFRGRLLWNHRQKFADGLFEGWTAQAEIGWISDRTFLEQYYEQEWDERKDQTTGLRLRRVADNRSFLIEANGRINDFFTQTQWLPRLDHYIIGQELADDALTWHAHTSVGYANQQIASTPTNPQLASEFDLLPHENDSLGNRIAAEGERLITRHELDLPLDVSPFKVVPYVLGEAGHWGADIEGNDIQRLYYQAGLRASIPFWTANPHIQDPVFNLNGLAHKVVFDAELSHADANRNYDEFPLYDEIDDDVFEEIRRRLFDPTFGGRLADLYYDDTGPNTIDPKFDPRYYLIRTGTQGWVTSPAMEMVDDLTVARLGMRHRLQTKRGLGPRQHIVDWITFDSNITYFPRSERDNFGSELGLADYDFRWHLGDRFSILSDGAADMFGDGLRTVSGGLLVNRPGRGNLYLGYRTIRGPFTADVLSATLNYRLSDKWLGSATAVVDFSEAGNIGQSITFSRIGESVIVSLGANVDESKNNVGFNFLVEPRFLSGLSATRRTGIEVPPVGAYGLE